MEHNNQSLNPNPYGLTLARNIENASTDVKATYQSGSMYVYLPCKFKSEESGKRWFYTFLETLPEIDFPLERIQVIIYAREEMQFPFIINPSEFDAQAENLAIEAGLNFSTDTRANYQEPMPLDHPYYSDKNYFKKHPITTKDITFDDIKDLPNVKPMVDDLKSRGLLD